MLALIALVVLLLVLVAQHNSFTFNTFPYTLKTPPYPLDTPPKKCIFESSKPCWNSSLYGEKWCERNYN